MSKLDLSKRWVILIGENGLGKTYLLKSIANSLSCRESVVMSLFDDYEYFNAIEWLLQAGHDIRNFENRYEKVKNMLIDLLPGVENIREKRADKAQQKPAIEVETGGGWIDMRNLGSGRQALITWTVDLASRLFERYPDCDNPLEQEAIVLVDQIELQFHLHPKWQRTIVSDLTRNFVKTQFIVTTHSPFIVQSVLEDANIVLLKQEGDQVVIHNNEEVIKGWHINEILGSDLFDLPSVWASKYDGHLKRREEISSKPQLTPEDERELEEIGEKLSEWRIVTKRSAEDNEALKLIRETAALLKTKLKPYSNPRA